MPEMLIRLEGQGGAFADVFRRYGPAVELRHNIPLRVETLDQGMVGGKPSIAFIIELPQISRVVIAQTSVKLFQMAAFATLAKYGDMTEGAVLGTFVAGGSATLTLSTPAECAGCQAADSRQLQILSGMRGEAMTFLEALQYFDEVRPLDSKMHVDRLTAEGQDIGVPYCCGLPVAKNSQDGVERISCSVCKTAIQYVTGYGWMVAYFASGRRSGSGYFIFG